jgi:hypothetical protein
MPRNRRSQWSFCPTAEKVRSFEISRSISSPPSKRHYEMMTAPSVAPWDLGLTSSGVRSRGAWSLGAGLRGQLKWCRGDHRSGSLARDSTSAISWSSNSLLLLRGIPEARSDEPRDVRANRPHATHVQRSRSSPCSHDTDGFINPRRHGSAAPLTGVAAPTAGDISRHRARRSIGPVQVPAGQ